MARKVDKPYASGTWSRARFFGFLRSGLRRMSVRWRPKNDALTTVRRPSQSDNKRLKWEFRCADCGGWFPRKEINVHHLVECGELKSFEDLPRFVERLFCEKAGFRVECLECHKARHETEKGGEK